MADRKAKVIREQLAKIEKQLSDAEQYVAQQVNVEGSAFLHLDDWRGKSGHPMWMRNFMIPTTLKHRTAKQQALEKIDKKSKDKATTMHRRNNRTKSDSIIVG